MTAKYNTILESLAAVDGSIFEQFDGPCQHQNGASLVLVTWTYRIGFWSKRLEPAQFVYRVDLDLPDDEGNFPSISIINA